MQNKKYLNGDNIIRNTDITKERMNMLHELNLKV